MRPYRFCGRLVTSVDDYGDDYGGRFGKRFPLTIVVAVVVHRFPTQYSGGCAPADPRAFPARSNSGPAGPAVLALERAAIGVAAYGGASVDDYGDDYGGR